jgi:hypothetical protein
MPVGRLRRRRRCGELGDKDQTEQNDLADERAAKEQCHDGLQIRTTVRDSGDIARRDATKHGDFG